MELSRISQQETGDPLGPDLQRAAQPQCDQCGSAVDDQQRYCVVCGAHLKHAYDPAGRYFSEVGSRARAPRGGSGSQNAAGHSRGVALAIVLALIPVAAAVGVLAGRSSSSQDAQLIRALARRQGAVTVAGAASPPAHVAARHAQRARTPVRHKQVRVRPPSKAVSTTHYGSVGQITGFKASRTAQQQGASDTQKVQKSTGKGYVNTQNNLPTQVVVP